MKYDTNNNKIEIASATSNKRQEEKTKQRLLKEEFNITTGRSTSIGKELIKSFSMLFFVIYVVWILNTLFLK